MFLPLYPTYGNNWFLIFKLTVPKLLGFAISVYTKPIIEIGNLFSVRESAYVFTALPNLRELTGPTR